MKVQIIKKGTAKAKPSGYCDFAVDEPPLNKR